MDSLHLPIFAMAGLALPRLVGERSRMLAWLTALTLRVLVPSLLFLRLYEMAALETPPWRLLASFYVPTFVVFIATAFVLRTAFAQPAGLAVVGALSAAYGNVVLTGIPIVEALADTRGSAPMLAIISVHSLLLLPGASFALAALTGSGSGSLGPVLRAALVNPVIAAIVLGAGCRLAGVEVALPARGVLAALAAATGPAAMLVLGAACARLPRERPSAAEALVATMKVVVLPALVAVACVVGGVHGPAYALVAVLLAAQPTGVNAVIFAGADVLARSFASRVVLVSTAAALAIIPALAHVADRFTR